MTGISRGRKRRATSDLSPLSHERGEGGVSWETGDVNLRLICCYLSKTAMHEGT